MNCMPPDQASKRYTFRFFLATAVYVALLFTSVTLLQRYHLRRASVVSLALLPSVPLLAMIAVVGLYLREQKDEFQRMVLQQSMLAAIGCTLGLASVWGFLEMFADLPHVPMFYIFPGFWFFVGVCTPFVQRSYRGAAGE